MAPKTKNTGASKAKARSVVSVAPKPKRVLRRRDTEQATARLLDESFPEMSPHDRDHKLVGGQSLRARCLAERRGLDANERVSQTFIKQMRQMYCPSGSVRSQLHWEDETLPLDDDLQHAFQALSVDNPTQRSRAPLLGWLKQGRDCNKREAMVLCRWVLDQNVAASSCMRQVVLHLMTYLLQCNAHIRFSEKLKPMGHTWDHTLAQHYAASKRERQSRETFWAEHRHLAPLLPYGARIDMVMQAPVLTNFVDDLHDLCDKSELAKGFFGSDLSELGVQRLTNDISDLYQDFLESQFTMEGFVKFKDVSHAA